MRSNGRTPRPVSPRRRALITGAAGMDGSHLSDLLIEKGYDVYGIVRHRTPRALDNISHLLDHPRFHFVQADLRDCASLLACLRKVDPHEIYNLAGQSSVGISWDIPEQTADVTGVGALRLLEAIRTYGKNIRFLQASSSEIFGNTTNFYPWDKIVRREKSNERTPFDPRSPYGVAKLFAHCVTKNYRKNYGMFNCSAILFNHEGPRRSLQFVTRKITYTVAQIALGQTTHIALGDLNARRDWGYAPEYVDAMWRMLQQPKADDFVIATGVSHSIRDLLSCAFDYVNIPNWKKYIVKDKRYTRLAEPDVLCGDAGKAKRVLKWAPQLSFKELVERMVEHDLRSLRQSSSKERPLVSTGRA
jgi:GDPmannose 4,6-dehydratase